MSAIVVSIDPGIRGTGVAVWTGITVGQLLAANYVLNPEIRGLGPWQAYKMARAVYHWLQSIGYPCPAVLAMEWPQVYDTAHSKGDPNDLLPLAGVDTALTTILATTPGFTAIYYKPREWKGQLEKTVMCDRIKTRLSPEELALIPNFGHLTHNVLDAVGIGLHHLGRLQPRKVIAR